MSPSTARAVPVTPARTPSRTPSRSVGGSRGATALALSPLHRSPHPPQHRTARPPALRLVPQHRSGAARAPFVALVMSLLAAGLLALLALNTLLAQDAFRLHTLERDGNALTDRQQLLERDVAALRAPQDLARRARALGMVPAGPPAFLRLSDGAVLGRPTAGRAPVAPAPVVPAASPRHAAHAAHAAQAGPAASAGPSVAAQSARPAGSAAAAAPAARPSRAAKASQPPSPHAAPTVSGGTP